ncbi:hypothetical protein GCM10022288_17950 [Gryllotalpicola kribbensis]|jgi:hypothetical protein|uniref:DUF2000 domain-containing protein n=1 Tax=Gryllotalpicola kribbensis TaxID=993084 RepID=A0ABP8ATL5_9MICO
MSSLTIGFDPDLFDPTVSTREAPLKWVIVVDSALPPGRAVNAAVCVAAATQARVTGLLGPEVADASGAPHPGLPWLGCTILAAPGVRLPELRAKAAAREDLFVADMVAAAQATRVYAEYVDELAARAADEHEYLALSLVGPRNRVDRLVGRLPLLG